MGALLLVVYYVGCEVLLGSTPAKLISGYKVQDAHYWPTPQLGAVFQT